MTARAPSVAEIAAHLGANPDTICKWITRNGMLAHKLGRPRSFSAQKRKKSTNDKFLGAQPNQKQACP